MLTKGVKSVLLASLLRLQTINAERLQSGEDSPLMQSMFFNHVKEEKLEEQASLDAKALLETNVAAKKERGAIHLHQEENDAQSESEEVKAPPSQRLVENDMEDEAAEVSGADKIAEAAFVHGKRHEVLASRSEPKLAEAVEAKEQKPLVAPPVQSQQLVETQAKSRFPVKTVVEVLGAAYLANYFFHDQLVNALHQFEGLNEQDVELAQQFMKSLPEKVQAQLQEMENERQVQAPQLAQLEEAVDVTNTEEEAGMDAESTDAESSPIRATGQKKWSNEKKLEFMKKVQKNRELAAAEKKREELAEQKQLMYEVIGGLAVAAIGDEMGKNRAPEKVVVEVHKVAQLMQQDAQLAQRFRQTLPTSAQRLLQEMENGTQTEQE